MKAYSKAAKLDVKRKRGRPLKEGQRTNSGQLSRAAKQGPSEYIKALEARGRLFKVPAGQESQPEVNTAIGRLKLWDHLSYWQHEALCEYYRIVTGRMKSVGAPDSLAVSASGGRYQMSDEAEEETFLARSRRFHDANRAIADTAAQANIHDPFKIVEWIVFRDIEMPHFTGALRQIANGLVHHFGYDRRQKVG